MHTHNFSVLLGTAPEVAQTNAIHDQQEIIKDIIPTILATDVETSISQ